MTWILFDWLGTFAFAVSGAMVGLSRRMDIFGIVVLAILTAVGGGMVRDVLVGITPPVALSNPTDLLLSIATAVLVSVIYEYFHINHGSKQIAGFLYNGCDTIGLASFTVTGALVGLRQGGPGSAFVLPIMLACITAVGGGMLRDLMAQRMPVVLRMDVYAVASLFGAFLMCLSWPVFGTDASSWIGFLSVLTLRALALRYGWQVYHPHPRRRVIHPLRHRKKQP